MTLAKKYGFGPKTVSDMTLWQQYMYLNGCAPQSGGRVNPNGTVTFENLEDALAFKQERQALING